MNNFYKKLKTYQRRLSSNVTIRERGIGRFLRDKDIIAKPQYIIPPYIVDFFIPAKGLILEIDGSVHNRDKQKEWDYKREDYLMSIGFMVQRFSNNHSNEDVLNQIKMYPNKNQEEIKLIYKRIQKIIGFFTHSYEKQNKVNDFRELLSNKIIK